jgi:hypothetical protein
MKQQFNYKKIMMNIYKPFASIILNKYFIFLFVCNLIFINNAYSQANLKNIDNVAQFVNANYNMGKIAFGKTVQYNVTIKNISKDTISIANVTVACGCTTPTYTKGQILQPGQTSAITLGFNGSSMGVFTKNATIFLGNGLSKQVQFNGEAVK